MPVNLSYPKARSSQSKLATLTFADTAAKELFWLPKNAVITGIFVIGSAVSNAVTAATIGIGSTSSANEYMTGYDVKTAATGEGFVAAGAAAVGSAMATPLTSDKLVYGIYADTGGAGTAGSWTVKVDYFVTGPNETL